MLFYLFFVFVLLFPAVIRPKVIQRDQNFYAKSERMKFKRQKIFENLDNFRAKLRAN